MPSTTTRRTTLPSPIVRSIEIRALYNEAQAADLESIAISWGVPLQTAVYGIVSTFLKRCRGSAAEQLRGDRMVEQACHEYLTAIPKL